ncbi:MAG TPA: Mo-dependent nitrogenase C-terminal domain-containing protein [Coleofasciculaceae cyanobacterium]
MLNLTQNNHQIKNTFVQDKIKSLNWLHPIRQWLNQLEIKNAAMAHLLCRVIPTQCPFERDIYLFGCHVGHIPPLCKLNPLYEEVVSLRFRALCYLADECNEDIGCYC